MNADIAYGEKLANLGIVQDEISGLSPLDSSDRKGAINVLDKLYSGERLNKKEIGGLINQYRGNITGSQNKLASYSLGKMAYDEVDINNDGKIFPEERDLYISNNIGRIKDENAFIVGLEAGKERSIGLRYKEKQLEDVGMAEVSERMKLNIAPLTGLPEDQAYGDDYTINSGRLIFNQYKNASNEDLLEFVNEYSETYVDQAVGVFDYSDVPALKEAIIGKALEYAKDNIGANTGLSQKDVENPDESESYQRFEERYFRNVMAGLNENTNYAAKSPRSLLELKKEEKLQLQSIYKDEFTELQNVGAGLKSLVQYTGTNKSIKYRIDTKDLSKKSGIKQEDIEKVFDIILNNESDRYAELMMKGDKTLQTILSFIPGGDQYLKLIKLTRAETQYTSPYEDKTRLGTKDKEFLEDMN